MRLMRVIHRDLKPENFLLTSADIASADLKLADFGFARFEAAGDIYSTVCGSPLYMVGSTPPPFLSTCDALTQQAPEVSAGSRYTSASDLWSLGIILFEFLVGEAPHAFGQIRKSTYGAMVDKINATPAFKALEQRLRCAIVDLLLRRGKRDNLGPAAAGAFVAADV
jgi:serine/threonine protein kinase